ncbi:hypothetical protein PGB90_004700 [Kerria lacca]
MKWQCAADSYPQTYHSKPFYLTDSSRPQETIANHYTDPPHPFGLYSVTRINPLYIEESATGVLQVQSELQNQDISANYNFTGCKKEYLNSSPLHDNAITVLKQNSDFIRSILVSVRLGHSHKCNGLTPIPEGVIDCVPRPIWPKDESFDSRYDDSKIQKTSKYKHKRWKYDKTSSRAMVSEKKKSLPEILRELSVSINNAMENADRVEIPPEAVLHSLREKINKCLDTMSTNFVDVSEHAGLNDNTVTTLSRAFSFVNSFNDGSHHDDIEKGRLLLLKRLGKFPLSESHYEQVQRSSSSSSSGASTSGFSDLTHTPVSSNSSAPDSPPASRTVENNEGPPTFLMNENSLIKYSDKSALSNCNANIKNAVSLSAFQYRVIQNQTNLSIEENRNESTIICQANEVNCLTETNSCAKLDTSLSCYPGRRFPDFTLDVQQAEKVMKKIQERKKERCWCRVITSIVGFVFLLFSLMFFSLMLTRGGKIFGSL